MPTFSSHQFMNQYIGQPTLTVLQQPPQFHHQIHVPSFIQPPNQRYQYQINNHLSGPGIPPPTCMQSDFNTNPQNIHLGQAQNIETFVPPQYSTDSFQPEKDNHEEQTRANINMPHENDLGTHKKESTEANNGARPKKIKKLHSKETKERKQPKELDLREAIKHIEEQAGDQNRQPNHHLLAIPSLKKVPQVLEPVQKENNLTRI
ncbi:unnamed protein product [Mytilus coruscus]|uniref:Uncharacterized protein n=1 Tax=Mytilus coruscus TaxID=42192 RepID=A0A6J8E925_MYTCO|nr:unnamed protein product [Mytilus coruscus]